MYSIDSRIVKENDVFIPIKGNYFDGHDFIPELVKKNIKILDVSLQELASYLRNTKIKAKVLGVTGSSGKTTLKDMLYTVLKSKYKVHSTFENQNNEIGAPLTIINAPSDADFIIVEMGMRHRGDLTYLTKIIKPDIVFISNIGVAHIELLKTQRNIALSKSEIFNFPKEQNKTYDVYLNENLNYFDLVTKKAKQNNFTINTVSEKNILLSNEKIVTKFAVTQQFSKKEVENILRNFKPTSPHREDHLIWNENIIIDDAYNANPDSMNFSIISAKNKYPNKKIITVFGEMKELGNKDFYFHKNLINTVISDPHIEKALFYGKTYLRIEKKHDKCYYYTDKSSIAKKINELNLKNRIILFKGSRSTKMETIIEELTKK